MMFQNVPSETQRVSVCMKPYRDLESERQKSIKHVKLAVSLSPHCEKRGGVFLPILTTLMFLFNYEIV